MILKETLADMDNLKKDRAAPGLEILNWIS